MASTTTVNALPYPDPADANNVPADMGALAAALDVLVAGRKLSQTEINALMSGQKPAGLLIFNTTTGKLQISNGSTFTDLVLADSPAFTGTVTLPATTSIGTVSATEIGYLDGVTSSIQTQLTAKAPTASPTFTGTVTAAAAIFTGVVDARVNTNYQTGTTYTLALSDAGKMVQLSNSSAVTLTVPLNSSVAFPVGTKIDLFQYGAGQVTVSPAGGVTLQSYGSKTKIAGIYAAATLIKAATDTWILVGNLA